MEQNVDQQQTAMLDLPANIRISNRNQVAQQWAALREEKKKNPKRSSRKDATPLRRHPSGIPSFCHVIGKAWQDTMTNIANTVKNKTSSSSSPDKRGLEVATNPSASAGAATGQQKGKSTIVSFPSVLQILQANALHEQVSQFAGSNATNNSSDTQSSSPDQEEALRVLPAGYDWNQAIRHMARARSRAFLLLDLASIVPTLVEWKRQLPRTSMVASNQYHSSSSNATKIQFLYTVQLNADSKLLQLLLRSHVGLVCTNKWDLAKCQQILDRLDYNNIQPTSGSSWDSEYSTATNLLYDNASYTGKPDGYLRQLVLSAGVNTVVVDGPSEVHRIQTALERMRQRRQCKANNDTTQNRWFILRLPSEVNNNNSNWNDLVRQTQQAVALSCKNGRSALVGISVDMSVENSLPDKRSDIEHALQLVEDNFKEWQCSSTDNQIIGNERPGVRLDMTGVSMPASPEMLAWWKTLTTDRPYLKQITVDVSHDLISPAGALCTRIIGVKEEQIIASTSSDNETKGDKDFVGHMATTPGETPSSSTETAVTMTGGVRMHYYIDDGCYGSLYHAAEHNAISNPLPLLYPDSQQQQQQGENHNSEHAQSKMFTSTVWGPTCDGLDRVCRDILLPKLYRDNWLVFPNLGCRIGEGLGTAFNGFAPPDTAYCVLGYFGK